MIRTAFLAVMLMVTSAAAKPQYKMAEATEHMLTALGHITICASSYGLLAQVLPYDGGAAGKRAEELRAEMTRLRNEMLGFAIKLADMVHMTMEDVMKNYESGKADLWDDRLSLADNVSAQQSKAPHCRQLSIDLRVAK